MPSRIILLLFLACCFNDITKAQDIIHKNDERIIAAKVTKVDSLFIHYKEITNLKGPTLSIPKTEVSHIRFDYVISNNNNNTQKNYVRAKNAVSFGLGGTGGILSLNYDRAFLETPNFFLSAKLGIGSWVSQTNINTHVTANFNFGGTRHYLELGLGGAVGIGQYDKYYKFYASVPIIGYRFQPQSEGVFFRTYACGFMLLQDSWGDNLMVPMFALDLGFSF